ncbi:MULTISPECIES: helix-turn-helix domain-containing protein [unclassified Mesorhizobium]|uniref:helix-turn-helix domain-containing protein n=1 Tax=unclassified Mesorhizobium TaxID=325217 RepID=UPI00112635A8|nr:MULTISPECIES: helix-turn-helix domain-containing protein [unclassified Mesorhizobium]MCA0025488.1 helix-turn-helix domain-containing protein [Mesorhizobium sp. B263B1A]TPJ97125.1 helix-turn-helix domain-containing protein [Mesorhizobium sp. B2-5-12]TPK27208.1 helix-turn-helix domain-containing protein [Mesorhizobium sp. B2-5-6]
MSEETTIRRGVRNSRYTTVPNHVFEDVNLSMEARWLLGYLLSKPDNWTVILGDIAKRGNCGRDKARRIVNELVQHGYADKEQEREDGRFGKLSLVIFDEPQRARRTAEDEGVASLPQTENPSTVLPSTANPTLVNTDGLVTPEISSERERERERDDQKSVERWLKRVHPNWPTFVADSGKTALAAALALTPSEREMAAERMAEYLAAEKLTKGRCAFGVYLSEKRWERLGPKPEAPEKPAYAPAFGPVWAAIRMRDLVTGPKAPPAPLKGWEERAITDGRLNRETLEKDNRMRAGWPMVNGLHRAAESAIGIHSFGPAEEQLGKLCEFVPVGTECWQAWKLEHEMRGWPWLPDPGAMRGVYFPAGGPGGLEAFEQAVRGNHDAGGREAAE